MVMVKGTACMQCWNYQICQRESYALSESLPSFKYPTASTASVCTEIKQSAPFHHGSIDITISVHTSMLPQNIYNKLYSNLGSLHRASYLNQKCFLQVQSKWIVEFKKNYSQCFDSSRKKNTYVSGIIQAIKVSQLYPLNSGIIFFTVCSHSVSRASRIIIRSDITHM